MNRRDFHTGACALGLLSALNAPRAWAQAAPVEGTQYVRLPQKVPTSAGPGKIEVIEFFLYRCEHCNNFDPFLEAWVKRLPADVSFRRVHVGFRPNDALLQGMFYALDALGQLGPVHRKIFYALHVEKQKVESVEAMADFVQRLGIDKAKFLDAYNSFGVKAKGKQTERLVEAYKIDGVPALGIQGQYYTSPSLAGSADVALRTADFLIAAARKGA